MSHTFILYTRLLGIMLFLGICTSLFATHNRAGEITYEQLDNLTIRATITTYTKASSTNADRDTVEICWGDGTCEWLRRANGPDGDNNGFQDGEQLPNDTKRNLYVMTHTYSGPSHYVISMQDPNRNSGILNVNFPTSEGIEFFIQTTVTLFPSQFQGFNNSPILLQPPIDFGCVGKKFIHNPNAFEPDGDSLSYELITPLRDVNEQVPNYNFPSEISPGFDNQIFLSATTGEFTWNSPQEAGEYNIAMRIVEYRNGNAIDTLIRDMQILIQECDNEPPVIETLEQICVIAGETLSFEVVGTDPDIPVQLIKMSALGGPFEVANPATFTVPPAGQDAYQAHPLSGFFEWQTTCEHISDQYYSVVFKAVDDFFGSTGLSTLKTVRIKVVGPPPLDVLTEADTDEIKVSWESPYACENAADEYFRGFSVWRRESSNNFPIDTCITGLDGQGYTRIAFNEKDLEDNRYVYYDLDVERGRTYCYRILAEFAKLTSGNFPFNLVESLPSEEACVQLGRDIPLITNVDVENTSNTAGEIEVRWSKPSAMDLDTILNPGPYRYQLYRATGITMSNFEIVPGADFSSPTFAAANDTTFLDTSLNTVDNAYSYQLAFYVNNESEPIGFTSVASSVYLTISPTDETNVLTWEEDVPWDNYTYTVFRKNPGSSNFLEIASVEIPEYRDEGLVNGEEYCYYIESEGSYGVEGIISPIFNKSQQVCSIPIDNLPPCPPTLFVSNICNDINDNIPEDSFINFLNWTNPNTVCPETDDTAGYNVFYASTEGEELELIVRIDFANDTFYMHQPDFGVAGCYAVTAIDSVGNESIFSNTVCVDNCPDYNLPNAFTPNNDGSNDLFIPYPYRFIDRIEIQIFNRWGGLVFETTDPDINWDGRNLQQNDLAEGTYFYTCKVFENRVTGVIQNATVLSGYIELVRGR